MLFCLLRCCLLAAFLATVLASGCTNENLPIVHGDVDRPGGDPTPGDAGGDGTLYTECRGTAASIRIGNAVTLDAIDEDPARCLLYAADRTGSEVYYIDTAEDVVRHVIAVGAQPTDLTLSADKRYVYVAGFGASEIVVLDADDGSIVDRVRTAVPPYRIARGPGHRVFYVEESVFSAVRDVNLISGDDTRATNVDFHEPDLEASADGTMLYLGEANQPGSKLLRFAADQPGVPEVDRYRFDGGFTLPSPQRRIFLAEEANRVFFADRAFHADELEHMRGWFGDQPLAANTDGTILATREFLFDGQTFVRFANRPHPGYGVRFSSDGLWLYEFDAIGSLLYRTAISTLVGVHRLGETNVPPGSLSQHHFNQLLADPNRPVIYALDSQQNQLVYIDRNLLMPVRAEIIGATPTDMAIAPGGDEMMVATFGATEVAIIDLNDETKALKDVILVPGNPFRVAAGPFDRVVYAEQDQYSDVTLLHRGSGEILASNTVFQPDIEFDPTGRYLYAGESAGPISRLRRFDLLNDTFEEIAVSTDTYSYPARKVIYDAGAVYFAG
ncbi:MAG: hypothetical protein V3T05_00400, partial [Myxococcota bacterium]